MKRDISCIAVHFIVQTCLSQSKMKLRLCDCCCLRWYENHYDSFSFLLSEQGLWSLAWRRMSCGGPSTSMTLPSTPTQGRRCLSLAACLLRCQWTWQSQAACSPSTGTAGVSTDMRKSFLVVLNVTLIQPCTKIGILIPAKSENPLKECKKILLLPHDA